MPTCTIEIYQALEWAWHAAISHSELKTAESIRQALQLITENKTLNFKRLIEEFKR